MADRREIVPARTESLGFDASFTLLVSMLKSLQVLSRPERKKNPGGALHDDAQSDYLQRR
jgi:hypothetical protein